MDSDSGRSAPDGGPASSSAYDALADLPLRIEDASLRRREAETTSEFTRVTTEIRLAGPEHVGRGEDVTYEARHHDALLESGLPGLAGEYTVDEFSALAGELDLFPGDTPEREVFRNYRRWGVESAALDLALRRADATLADALGRSYDPVRFLVSTRLGDPPSPQRVRDLLDADPATQFKLDATPEWDDELVAALAETGAVRTVDCKGHYEGTEVDVEADPALYRRVLEGFPAAVIEDPALTPETEPLLDGEWHRVSWDAPVHSVAELEALPDAGWLNVKPSRFGSAASLLAAFEHCAARGIDVYLGGQFELGPGREHLHALASVFCPGAPNDAAPTGYNDPTYDGPLPSSPLGPPPSPRGLAWDG